MKIVKDLLIYLIISSLFTLSLFAQSKPHKHKIKNFPKENARGCPLSYVSRFDREKPSHLAGLLVYGFRKLFGSNFIQIPHYQCVPEVKELNLSEAAVYVNCQSTENECPNNFQKVNVSVEAVDAENDVLTYDYTVSGGKIVGQGAKVVWDLSDVPPGIYMIRVYADDGCGDCGGAMTKEVKVIECCDSK